jgi:hypothetical protein
MVEGLPLLRRSHALGYFLEKSLSKSTNILGQRKEKATLQ